MRELPDHQGEPETQDRQEELQLQDRQKEPETQDRQEELQIQDRQKEPEIQDHQEDPHLQPLNDRAPKAAFIKTYIFTAPIKTILNI